MQSLGELYSENNLSNEWPRFIQKYAGLTVIGNAKELYLVSSVSPRGKQKKQIHVDTVSPSRFSLYSIVALSNHGQDADPITAVAWALNGESPLDPLLVIALSSIVCVYSVGRGEPTGFLRGHGGVCFTV